MESKSHQILIVDNIYKHRLLFIRPSISRAGWEYIETVNYIIYVTFPHISQTPNGARLEKKKISTNCIRDKKCFIDDDSGSQLRLFLDKGGWKCEFLQLASLALINQKLGSIPKTFEARN